MAKPLTIAYPGELLLPFVVSFYPDPTFVTVPS